MSLIEEALRRAQEAHRAPEPRDRSTPSPQPVQSPKPLISVPEPPASPASRSWIARALIGGGFVLVIGFVAWEVWVYLVPVAPPTRQSVVAARSTSPQVVQASLNAPARKPLGRPRLELNGVVGGPGEPLVIINGNIVRLGETVEGATLLAVGEDSATLRWRDREVVLRTNQ